jgi:hypothetical protein
LQTGRIPQADVCFPHLQLFLKLAAEFFKVGRLLGSSSDNRYAIFMSPGIHFGLVQYSEQVEPWFVYRGSRHLQFRYSSGNFELASPDVLRLLKEQYLKCYQKVCADAQTNPNPMTVDRWDLDPYEAGLRSDFAAANLSTTESHTMRQLAAVPRGRGRGRGAGRGAARGGGQAAIAASEQSCLRCGVKGHDICDCPTPPSPAAKKVGDELLAKLLPM